MNNKFFILVFIWAGVIAAYVFMGVAMPAITDIIATTNTSMHAGNMTGLVGIDEAVNSAPVWLWFIPGLVGVVVTVVELVRK